MSAKILKFYFDKKVFYLCVKTVPSMRLQKRVGKSGQYRAPRFLTGRGSDSLEQ